MKRERLRRVLALAILETLGVTHKRTLPNVKRYVSSSILSRSRYRINKSTRISDIDILIALRFIRGAIARSKPISFYYAPIGSAIAEERKHFFLTAPIVELTRIE